MIRARLRAAGGWTLLVVGTAALFVPLVPGTAIMVAGLALLGREHPLVPPVLSGLVRLREWWRGAPVERR